MNTPLYNPYEWSKWGYACPKCNGISYRVRTNKRPKYVCPCGKEFEVPKRRF